MPVVASVNYVTKRIYLSASTVGATIDTLDVYKEVRQLRRLTDAHQQWRPMIVAGGNVTKVAGVSATPSYVQLLHGCRIIPYDTNHSLKVVRDTFTDDGLTGRDCFDRTALSATSAVDIDVDFSEIEIRFISTGGGGAPTPEQNAQAVWSHLVSTLVPGSAAETIIRAKINAANAFSVAASK